MATRDAVVNRYGFGLDKNAVADATSTPIDAVAVDNVGQASQHVENLDGGTWYFAVTAFDADNLESAKSTIVSKTIM